MRCVSEMAPRQAKTNFVDCDLRPIAGGTKKRPIVCFDRAEGSATSIRYRFAVAKVNDVDSYFAR